jgi:hypothetical protein
MKQIQYELSEHDFQIFEWLKKATRSITDQELLDNAITMLQWGIEQVRQERQVASFDARSKSYRVLQMPALQNATDIKPAAVKKRKRVA